MKLGLNLTPDMLEASYEFLRLTPPFRRWKLPKGDAVEFYVKHCMEYAGLCHDKLTDKNGAYRITVSTFHCGQYPTLFEVMAHEMVHLRQYMTKTFSAANHHNKDFNRLAAQVCAVHGFDSRRF